MANKIDIEEVEFVLQENKAEPQLVKSTMEKLRQLLEEAAAEKEGQKREKQEIVLLYDKPDDFDSETLEKVIESVPVYVMSITEGEDHNTLVEKIEKAAKNYNENSKRGKKKPVKEFTDMIRVVSASYLKEEGIGRKSKDPVIGVVKS